MLLKNKYCCKKHAEIAFDDFVKENKFFPTVEKISNKKCSYCENDAVYVLKKLKNTGHSELLDL